MHIALVEAKDAIGLDGTGREHLHRAGVIEAIQDPSYRIVLKGLRRDRLAQQQGRILLSKKLFQAIEGTPSTQGIENHAQHNGPWIDRHLRRYSLIDRLDQTHLVRIGLHNGQMLDLVRFDSRENEPHTTLLRRRLGSLLSCDDNITLLGCAVRGKNAPGKKRGSPSEGCGM